MLRLLQAVLPPTQQTALLDGFHRMLAGDRACLVMNGSSDKLGATLRTAIAQQLALPRVWQAMISENDSFVPDGDQPSSSIVRNSTPHICHSMTSR
jgi:hypothetical protein